MASRPSNTDQYQSRLRVSAPSPFLHFLWRQAGAAFVASCLVLASLPAQSQEKSSPATPAPFILGFDPDPNTFATRWTLKIYTEAFKRLGISLKPEYYPLARKTALVDEGTIDGDAGRIGGFGAAHPSLIRVDEPIIELSFAFYTANPGVRLQKLEDLNNGHWKTEYRRGIFLCETVVKKHVPANLISDVTSEDQGLQKLLAGRTDVYCDLDTAIRKTLHESTATDKSRIHQALSFGALPIYPYLHHKHAKLAPRLAATLKQMKAEGLIDTYRFEAEREMGWKP